MNDAKPDQPQSAKPKARPAKLDRNDLPEDLQVPVQNAPVVSKLLGRWTIDGYSRAAVQSYWRVQEMKIGFDAGAHPWDFMSLPRLFITHGHLDHIASLPAYIARRRMMKMEQPVIYMPECLVDPTHALLRIFTRLDRGRLTCELIGLKAGDEVELSRELVVTTTATRHSVTSLGYVVWERRKKLKPEYTHLTGDQIRDLRLSGTEVTHETRIPTVAYTGDTAPQGLDDCEDFYRAEVLITELTFLAPNHRKEMIHKHGHTHLDDLVARKDLFQNQHIVCGHFSTRYTDQQIVRWVRKAFPDMLGGRLHLWLTANKE
jgi:ribonuclease Z